VPGSRDCTASGAGTPGRQCVAEVQQAQQVTARWAMSSDGWALSAGRSVSHPLVPRAASQSHSTRRAAAGGQLSAA